MKLRLVKNGVFPITKDASGAKLDTATEFPIPGTIQGEGKLAGIPSLFIRLSGCNLRCAWYSPDGNLDICDTPYSSHHADEWDDKDIDEIVALIQLNRENINHVVITGGEPMMQAEGVAELAMKLKKLDFHITMESNATYFDADVARYIDLFSLSPKLSSSIPFGGKIAAMKKPIDAEATARHKELYRNIRVIQKFIDACFQTSFYADRPDSSPVRRGNKDFQLKFVVSDETDISEIKDEYLAKLHKYDASDIMLMPLGADHSVLSETSALAAKTAIENGWRFTPRLQINLFGNKSGT